MIVPQHGAFTIERRFRATPARVFDAFGDPAKRKRWQIDSEASETLEFVTEFRVGGRDFSRFRFGDMPEMFNEGFYLEIIPDTRIVLAYAMGTAEGRFSASLITITLAPDGDGALMTATEQATFFEGGDGIVMREQGWRELLDALAKELGE
jgi:uncharacterized protein YndB with AHSA1/START domain